MIRQLIKIASLGLASTIIFSIQGNKAQAFDFTFSDVNVGASTASGIFSIDDAAISNGVLSTSDFEDWEIELSRGSLTRTLYGPGGSFGSNNSSFYDTYYNSTAYTDGTTLSFTSPWIVLNTLDGSLGAATFYIGENNSGTGLIQLPGVSRDTDGDKTVNDLVVATATPVPFEVSTDLSALMLGGLFGVIHLRKKMVCKH